jgi:hypothetical protein
MSLSHHPLPWVLAAAGILALYAATAVPPPIPAAAQQRSQPQVANGYQQITSLGSATALTIPAGSSYAVVCVETQAVRWRDDGTAPTSTVGMPIPAGNCMQIVILVPTKLQFIQQASSATIDVSYYQ